MSIFTRKLRRPLSMLLCGLLCAGALLPLAGCTKAPTVAAPDETLPCEALEGKTESYIFSGPFTLDFAVQPDADTSFNCFALDYVLTGPVGGTVVYTTPEGEATETFFLTETDDSFSQLIDGYLSGREATGLVSITLRPLRDESVTLTLRDVSLTVQPVLPDVLTIQNDRYRLGVKLSWGGGVSLLEDKQCPRQDIANLLNCHDTGRLIQQSYYGVTYDPNYVNGRYMNADWPYNPVQGGDQYGNRSKIVAVSCTDDSITITSRPLDWAKDNSPTFAYYTNTYTLMDDVVRVDNTVIDFSGYAHPSTTQEMPAFYTVSALGNFVCYDGDAPWTGDALTHRDDLRFWGGNPDSVFGFSPDNTETWCAWVDADGYGVGVFTPGVEQLSAGRYQYNGSPNDHADATNYVAPLATLELPCYQPFSYSYYVGAGRVEQLRAAFAAHKDDFSNDALRQPLGTEFDFADITFAGEEDLVYFSATNQTQLRYADGCAVLTATTSEGPDPYVNLRYGRNAVPLQAQDYPYLVLIYRTDEANSPDASHLELFFAADTLRQAAAGYSKVFSLVTDGSWQALVVPLEQLPYWHGRINLIRLDYFSAAKEGDTFYLSSMTLAESEADAEALAAQRLSALQTQQDGD